MGTPFSLSEEMFLRRALFYTVKRDKEERESDGKVS
jgi:hypothetical protein